MKRRYFIFASVISSLFSSKRLLGHFNNRCTTQSDAEGPFYKKGAPERTSMVGDYTDSDHEGLLKVSGIVKSDCDEPVANAVLDIWHAGPDRKYDMSGKYLFRAKVRTDKYGKYEFQTLMPSLYPGRPRHIHMKIISDKWKELTTQMYFENDPTRRKDYLCRRNGGSTKTAEVTSEGNIKIARFDIYLAS